MSEENPYRSPESETGLTAKNFVLAQRSWAVHWVAMISLGFGALMSVLALMMIAECFVIQQRISNYTESDFMAYNFSQLALAFGLLYSAITSVLTLSLITAGLGVWRRKRWGRIVAIILGFFTAIIGLWLGVIMVNQPSPTDPGTLKGAAVDLAFIFYSLFVLNVLLRKKYKAEFVGVMPVIKEDAA